jgi:hypothetical protein
VRLKRRLLLTRSYACLGPVGIAQTLTAWMSWVPIHRASGGVETLLRKGLQNYFVFEGDLFRMPIPGRGILLAKADSRTPPVAATTRPARDDHRCMTQVSGTLLLEFSRLPVVAANARDEMDDPDVE